MTQELLIETSKTRFRVGQYTLKTFDQVCQTKVLAIRYVESLYRQLCIGAKLHYEQVLFLSYCVEIGIVDREGFQ